MLTQQQRRLWQPGEKYHGWQASSLGLGLVVVVLFWYLALAAFASEPFFRHASSTFPERAVLYLLIFSGPIFGTFVWMVSTWRHAVAHMTPVKRWLIRRSAHSGPETNTPSQ